MEDKTLKQRIRSGRLRREDVARRLAELAFGDANDCVRLVLERDPPLARLNLSMLSEVKRSEKGALEVKLVDRLQALEQLSLLVSDGGEGMAAFLQALRGEEGTS